VNIQIECHTRFDITATGVRGHFRSGQLPFRDLVNHEIRDQVSWTRARNQQRNWETVNQVISLRCLPENISFPAQQPGPNGTTWSFRFEVTDPAAVAKGDDAVGWLKADCVGVPMIIGLDEDQIDAETLDPADDGNIFFLVQNK
jgi:hypothetical protein